MSGLVFTQVQGRLQTAILVLGVIGAISADGASLFAQQTKPVVAVFDPQGLPSIAAAEAALLEQCEFSRIDAASLDEAGRDAIFSPQGLERRKSLAEGAKAEVLVLARQRKDQTAPAIEWIVCQAASGLRFAAQTAPAAEDGKAIAEQISRAVRAAIEHGGAAIEVFSPRPFSVADDNPRIYYLAVALEALVAAKLDTRPRAIAIETAEAYALTALIAANRREQSLSPYSVAGDWRIEGQGDERRMSLFPAIYRGGRMIARVSRDAVPLAETAAAFEALLDELLAKLPSEKREQAKSSFDAAALALRAKSLAAQGRDREAWAAIEASLLIKPGQEELHHDAIVLLGRLTQNSQHNPNQDHWKMLVAYYRRGLEHIELFARCGGTTQKYDRVPSDNFINRFLFTQPSLNSGAGFSQRIITFAKETKQFRTEMLLRALPLGARAGWQNEAPNVRALVYEQRPRKRADLVLSLIESIKDLPDAQNRAYQYALHGGLTLNDTPELQDFLTKLQALKFQGVEVVVQQIRDNVASYEKQRRERPDDFPAADEAAVANELRVFAPQAGDDSAKRAPLVALALPEEPARIPGNSRLPVLAREIVRQALLVAAREERGCLTRDAVLGEPQPKADAAAELQLRFVSRFFANSPAEFELSRPGREGRFERLWSEEVAFEEDDSGLPNQIDYRLLAETAERWSREAFPKLLAPEGAEPRDARPQSDAAVPDAIAEQLLAMTETSQCTAIRDLHAAIREQGESDELLAALARGYANLGVLVDFHWNPAHKAFQARSLLYAQRLVARHPQRASSLRVRAYAMALCGLAQLALADLADAGKLAADDPQSGDRAEPGWLAPIDEFCHAKFDALGERIGREGEGQLAGLLAFLLVEGNETEGLTLQTARRVLEANPECYRVHDSMCATGGIATKHRATEIPPSILARNFPLRLQGAPGLPAAAANALSRKISSASGFAKLVDALADARLEDDRAEFTWNILGGLIRETQFIQLWRRVYFMRYEWAVPTDEYVEAILPLAAKHRYKPLIEMCGVGGKEWFKAANRLMDAIDLREIDFRLESILTQNLRQTWHEQRQRQYADCRGRGEIHRDDTVADLLARIPVLRINMAHARRLLQLDPFSPRAHAEVIKHDWEIAAARIAEWEREFAGAPIVMRALADRYAGANDLAAAQRCLAAYLKKSPDFWAYRKLAGTYQAQGDVDNWKKTLDEFLTQEDYGLEHAQVRVEIARHFMRQKEWELAQPYAEDAAESWAEWAMMCAIQCYQGSGDAEREGVWRGRLIERYPNAQHYIDYYFWAKRSGSDDADQVGEQLEPLMEAMAEQAPAKDQHQVGAYFQLNKRLKEALAAYRKAGADTKEPRYAFAACFRAVVIAEELGDADARNEALQAAKEIRDPALGQFRKLAAWLEHWTAQDKQQPVDIKTAQQIADNADDQDRPGINYIVGRFLELRGRAEESKAFLDAAATDEAAAFSLSKVLACAALRDRGLEPGKLDDEAGADEKEVESSQQKESPDPND